MGIPGASVLYFIDKCRRRDKSLTLQSDNKILRTSVSHMHCSCRIMFWHIKLYWLSKLFKQFPSQAKVTNWLFQIGFKLKTKEKQTIPRTIRNPYHLAIQSFMRIIRESPETNLLVFTNPKWKGFEFQVEELSLARLTFESALINPVSFIQYGERKERCVEVRYNHMQSDKHRLMELYFQDQSKQLKLMEFRT